MSTIKTKNIKQTVISGTTQPLKIGGILEDGSDAKISIGSDGTTTVVGTGQLIAEYVVTGSAVTSVNFSGLDINSHKSYRVEIELTNPSTTISMSLQMFINGDITTTNYYSQALYSGGSNLVTSSSNTSAITSADYVNRNVSSTINLMLVNGYSRATSMTSRQGSSTGDLYSMAYGKVSTVSNITQLTFTSSVASGIGVGSKIRIYRG